MHHIEPHYNWRQYYVAAEDEHSPFFGKENSEFMYTDKIYNYYIHPQWDAFGSATMYLKLIYSDYDKGFAIIELIGEWNDCINNDIMFLKNNIIDFLQKKGIYRFILLGENILNFHTSDDCYYQEWFEEVVEESGWVVGVNFRPHVIEEMKSEKLHYYINIGEEFSDLSWRNYPPDQFCLMVNKIIESKIGLFNW